MRSVLEILEPILTAPQRERVAAIVRQRSTEVVAGTDLAQDVQRLLQLVRRNGEFRPAFEARPPTDPRERMEGDAINGAMEALGLDLHTLYEVVNQLSGTSVGLEKILHSRLESFRASLSRLADDILGYRLLKHTTGFARVITQGFADGRNETGSGNPAHIDAQTRTLKLVPTRQERYHQRRGINPTTIEIVPLSAGLSGTASRSFAPEHALDPNPDSFWADLLLAPAPIQTTYTNSLGVTSTYNGALVEARLKLGAPEFVTDVKILPFGDYPITIIDVKFRQGGSWYRYPGFVQRTPTLNWLEWHGARVLADEVAFVLQQPTYTRVRYHIPRTMVAAASFWEQLLDEETNLTLSDASLTDFQKQQATADSHYASLYEGLRRYGLELERLDIPAPNTSGQIADAEVVGRQVEAAGITMTGDPKVQLTIKGLEPAPTPPPDDLIEVERVEYVFGARELQANDAEYFSLGHYASPKYTSDSTVLTLQLNTTEEHPSFVDSSSQAYRLTSIEYDLELAPGRRSPILPKGTTTVTDELLQIDRTARRAVTRFPASSTTVTVRQDGVTLPGSFYSVASLSTGHLQITFIWSGFTVRSAYTIRYTPTTNQDQLDVESLYDSVLLERPESFTGTSDTGLVQLQHYPFVEYQVINNEDDFIREQARLGRWLWVGGKKQTLLDGVMYADANTTLASAITSTQTTVPLTSAASLSASGSLLIGTEQITYTAISTNTLTGVTRGVNGTIAQAQPSGFAIVGERSYEPLIVHVGDIRAHNITDYLSGRHPAFLAATDDTLRYEFLHVGRKLYFNRPIQGRTITARYRWMTQYLQVLATLRSHLVGRVSATPIVQRYHLEVESTVL